MKTIRLLSSDLDGTLLGDDAATARFRVAWLDIDPTERPLLVYNSGRLLDDLSALLPDSGLPEADYLIGGVGTMLGGRQAGEFGRDYADTMGAAFDAGMIERLFAQIPGLRKQPARFLHDFKSSWYLDGAGDDTIARLEAMLVRAGLDVRLVYSSSRDLDVLPRHADKGSALAWLCRRLRIGLEEVVVAGDTGNDASMFTLAGVRGIVVGNALAELTRVASRNDRHFHARAAMADGVLEGLAHWEGTNFPISDPRS